jgi:hypothetical protein
MRPRLTYANVVATLALIIAVGGASAFAATQLAKNSVGSKQLKRNAVTTAKVKNGAITGEKIDVATLPKVPSATRADHAVSAETATGAGTAINATHATTADSATVARGVAAPEPVRQVDTPGQPPFAAGCENAGGIRYPAGFYKDDQEVVHLRGTVTSCATNELFNLPAGYRPATGMYMEFNGGQVSVWGPGIGPGEDGLLTCLADPCNLNGITFRAES